MRIDIYLHKDRTLPGVIRWDEDSSARCFGKSDNAAAKKAGNESRDPLKPYGDIPLGNYKAVVTVPGSPDRSYGPHKRLNLTPTAGPALQAFANGRYGIMIHGGDLAPNGNLRPTHGCVRVDDHAMENILLTIDEYKGGETLVYVWEV